MSGLSSHIVWPDPPAPGQLSFAIGYRIAEALAGRGEDRVATAMRNEAAIIVVADGAGGVSGGARAAEAICSAPPPSDAQWTKWLSDRDRSALGGEAAAIAMSITKDGAVSGASVGDCEAWIVQTKGMRQLTAFQERKPLLGSGTTDPRGFTASLSTDDVLVVATDGLWKYMSLEQVRALARSRPIDEALDAIVQGLRFASGALPDDVAVVICKITKESAT